LFILDKDLITAISMPLLCRYGFLGGKYFYGVKGADKKVR
jgi:hypothetical protein